MLGTMTPKLFAGHGAYHDEVEEDDEEEEDEEGEEDEEDEGED